MACTSTAQIPLKGSVVKFKAVGTVASVEVEIPCIDEDFNIPWGSVETKKKKCHNTGTKISRGKVLDFDEVNFSLSSFPSDKADKVVEFILDSLYETTGTDFDTSDPNGCIEYTIEITFADANANVITMQGFTRKVDSMAVLDDELTLSMIFQPTTAPIRA